MEASMVLIMVISIVLLSSSSTFAQTAKAPALSPTPVPAPAPAPGPSFVNLTDLLSVAGPFQTFLQYLESTEVIDTFQNQANNTEEGITIFVPKDAAFSSLRNPSLSNLTQDQLKSLILFHAFPHYYSLADFRNLSSTGSVPTFAGGDYALNLTDKAGTVQMSSGWTNTKVTSAVYSTDPVAIYEVDKVLLPEAIFGTDIPPMSAPAPAPVADIAPAADSPAEKSEAKTKSSQSSSSKAVYSYRSGNTGIWSHLMLALSGMLVMIL